VGYVLAFHSVSVEGVGCVIHLLREGVNRGPVERRQGLAAHWAGRRGRPAWRDACKVVALRALQGAEAAVCGQLLSPLPAVLRFCVGGFRLPAAADGLQPPDDGGEGADYDIEDVVHGSGVQRSQLVSAVVSCGSAGGQPVQ
jgi:hypothetical protein